MKNKIKLLSLISLLFFTNCFSTERPVRIKIKVINENGEPVVNSIVVARYPHLGNRKPDRIKEYKTDETGTLLIKEMLELPIRINFTISKSSYYENNEQLVISTYNNQKGDYIEEGEITSYELVTILKSIKNPIPMFAKKNVDIHFPIGKKVGFDIHKGELIPPFGSGEVIDFYLFFDGFRKNITIDGINTVEIKRNLSIDFPNREDGLTVFQYDFYLGSRLGSPHKAPDLNYHNKYTIFFKNYYINESLIRDSNIDKRRSYIFRTRTEIDKDGELIQAHYSKFYCDDLGIYIDMDKDGWCGVLVEYLYFNPNNLDRNLEFDPSKNLANPDKKHRVDLP